MKDVNFSFKDYLYRYEILGGVQIYDIYGMPGFFQLYRPFQFLNLHPITMYNGYVISFQLFLGYLGAKASSLLAEYFYDKKNMSDFRATICALVFSFMPMLGLRITHGHINIELITIPLFFVVLLGFHLKRFSIVDLVLTSLALFIICPPNGQVAVYVAFFPGLVYLALTVELWKSGKRRELGYAWVFLLLASLGSFLVFVPELSDRLLYLKSSDALRSLDLKNIVYSYTTHSWKDLVAGLSFVLEPFPTRDHYFLLHETNYPIGPLFFLLALMPLKKHKVIFLSILITTLFIFGFSMDIFPFQDILLTLNPLLGGFRVPARSINIFLILTFILACSFFLAQGNLKDFRDRLRAKPFLYLLPVLTASLLFMEPVLRDVIFTGLLGVGMVGQKLKKDWANLAVTLFLPALLCSVLSSFKERYRASEFSAESFDHARDLGKEIKAKFPQLQSPLARVSIIGNPGKFQLNFPLLIGLSSVDGYRLMHKRFLHTLDRMRGIPTSPLELNMYYPPGSPNYDLVSEMYNIVATVGVDIAENKISIQPNGRLSRQAWFVPTLTMVKPDQLTTKPKQITESGLILEDSFASLVGVYPGCETATINNISSTFNNQNTEIAVTTKSNCPLIISTNYTEKLNAFDGTGLKLVKFPAWGSLLGVIVPKGTTHVSLRPTVSYPHFGDWVSYLGWLLLAINCIWFSRLLLIPLFPGNSGDRA